MELDAFDMWRRYKVSCYGEVVYTSHNRSWAEREMKVLAEAGHEPQLED